MGYRYSILSSLALITASAGHIFEESLAKDLWKAAKSHSTDKSGKVIAASFELFQSLVTHRAHFKSSSDYESLKNYYQKAIDSQFPVARQSAANCFASCLILLTAYTPPPISEKTAKSKDFEETEGEHGSSQNQDSSGSHSKVKAPFTLSFTDALSALASIYTHASSSTRTRVGVTQTFALFIMASDPQFIESKFPEISRIVLYNILSDNNIARNRHKFLLARQHAKLLITQVLGFQILGEFGQLAAIKTLTNDILKTYPKTLKEQEEAPKEALVGATESIQHLLSFVGSAISQYSETLKDTLVSLISHPSYTVQVAACSCLRQLVSGTPSLIIPLLNNSLSHINKTMPLITTKHAKSHQVTGHAMLCSILISITYKHPLYSSIDIASRVLTTATSFLKATGDIDVFTSALQVEVSWFLISGIMPLGPNFLKVHLSQLLLLWKNSIPKVMSKDRFGDKSALELCYLYHVRHCALGSITSFLANNSKLITPDVAKRIIQLLQNALLFMNAMPSKVFAEDESTHLLDKSITLSDYDYLLKRRVLQCYVYLAQYAHTLDAFPASLLPFVLSVFADPEKFNSANLSTTIATSSGNIDSIWQTADNFAFGVTTNVSSYDIVDIQHDRHTEQHKRKNSTMEPIKDVQDKHWLSECNWLDELEKQVNTPILCAYEQDAEALLYVQEEAKLYQGPAPAPTSVVNLSIELFAILFPLQTPKVQESLLVQLSSYLYSSSSSTQKSDRLSAVFINASVAVYSVLKYVLTSDAVSRENLKSSKVLSLIIKIFKPIIASPDPILRNIGAQTIGMACSKAGTSSSSGSTSSAEVIKYLIDEIVQNTDPNSRAGCSVALGYILKHVGGMFAGLHLKTVLGILMSLATDPHPTVHFWALESISIIITSVGLSFSNYTLNTLSTLYKLYLQESHGDEMSSVASSNLDKITPTCRIIARCVHALIDVMGPDIQESTKSQQIVLSMIQQFEFSKDYICLAEAIRSTQELTIFAPNIVNIQSFLVPIVSYISIPYDTPVKTAAIDVLYQLMRTHSRTLFRYSTNELKRDVFRVYDMNPENKTMRAFIKQWVEQTAETEPLEWVTRVQKALFKSRKDFMPVEQTSTKSKEADLADEEVASFAKANNDDNGFKGDENSFEEPLKWQTRVLCVEALRDMIKINFKDKSTDEIERSPVLRRIGDIIRIAFSSSTASILELRMIGVQLLNDILISLQNIQDPDFREVSLLEQYQAQISSALTPAFTGDTSPELAALAINVCATFIGIGIIKSVERMGRILRLLISSLESCTGKEIVLGDLKSLSPNAQVMLRMAILSSWADLQVASASKEFLQDVVSPYTSILIPLWLSSLREFAELRFEPEQSSSLSNSSLGGSIDHMYSALSRNSILPYYQKSWLQLVDAIATLIEQDPSKVFTVLNNPTPESTESDPNIKYGNEPAAFFFVLFGILFESLIRPQQTLGNGETNTSERRTQILSALKRILHPSVCGNAIYKDMVFVETIDTLDRLVLTGTVAEQQLVVDIACRLCIHHPDNARQVPNSPDEAPGSEVLSERVDQLFELIRVVMLSLTNILPYLVDEEMSQTAISNLSKPAYITLVRKCLDNLVAMVEVFPTVIRVDLYACLLFVFGKTLEKTPVIGSVVPKSSLIPFKALVQHMVDTRNENNNNPNRLEYCEAIENAMTTLTIQLIAVLKNASSSTPEGLSQKGLSLLALVIVFKNASPLLQPPSRSASYNEASSMGTRIVNELSQLLVGCITVPEIQHVSAECLRAILATSQQSRIGQALIIKTIPPLVSLATSEGGSSGLSDDEDEEDEEDLVIEEGDASDPSANAVARRKSSSHKQKPEKPSNSSIISRLVIEILVEFVKSIKVDENTPDSPEQNSRIRSLLAIVIPLLLWYAGDSEAANIKDANQVQKIVYVKSKLFELVQHSSIIFKEVLQRGLTPWQKKQTETIMMFDEQKHFQQQSQENGSSSNLDQGPSSGAHIQLKSFA